MNIEKNKVVMINYTLKDSEGEIIDSSEDSEPLAYLHGNGNLIPGLEKQLEGKKPGDKISCVIAPADAYGEVDQSLVFSVKKSNFADPDKIEEGMQFEAQGEHGSQVVTVKAIQGDDVTIDANHPLAGETLHFNVNIVEVREPTDEELQHGHVHAESGCGCECGCDDGCESDSGCGEESGCGCGCCQ